MGFALGTGVPIVSLKLGKASPPGFINHEQAYLGNLAAIEQSAEPVMQLVSKKLGCYDKLINYAIRAFIESPNFNEAKRRFDIMQKVVTKLDNDQSLFIINGYKANEYLYACYYLKYYDRMIDFLNKTTGYTYMVDGKSIKRADINEGDDLPF